MKCSGKIALTAAFLSLALAMASCASASNRGAAANDHVGTLADHGESTTQRYSSTDGINRDEDGQWDCDGSTTPGLGATN
jgi:hypothetical protein